MIDPADHLWWLASRASGVVALAAISLAVGFGLALAARLAPERAKAFVAVHEQLALVGLVATAVHGITLLGDEHLDPGLAGIAVPFLVDHARVWTGLGVLAGWLAAALGLSYHARHWLGPARWRAAHRATILVYALSVAHTVGAGTDAGSAWMWLVLLSSLVPVSYLAVLRVLPRPSPPDAFRGARVSQTVRETVDVTTFVLDPAPGGEPGQFVSVRVEVPGHGVLVRSYSLSGPDRISVRRDGVVSRHLHSALTAGSALDVSGPFGTFVLDEDARVPVVLASAGIGATPVLAMLRRLAATGSEREIVWLHGARRGAEHAFADEVERLIGRLPHARAWVTYSRPDPDDRPDATGRLSAEAIRRAGIPGGCHAYVCGPAGFMEEAAAALQEAGAARISREAFGAAAPTRPSVAFRRSGVETGYVSGSLLELAESHGLRVPSGCRMGACQGCAVPLVSGRVQHEPGIRSPAGAALLCCARPLGDLVLDV